MTEKMQMLFICESKPEDNIYPNNKMKILPLTTVAVTCVAFSIPLEPSYGEEEGAESVGVFEKHIQPYISIEGGGSSWSIDSGGLNAQCGCYNEGDDDGFNGIVRASIGARYNRMRAEIGLTYLGGFESVTSGVEGPQFDPSQYEVATNYEVISGKLTLTYDVYSSENTKFYIGAGIGVAGIDLTATDTVWSAESETTDLAWHVGAGLEFAFSDSVSLILNYRFADMGTAEANLRFPISDMSDPTDDGGDFTADIITHQVSAGLMFRF